MCGKDERGLFMILYVILHWYAGSKVVAIINYLSDVIGTETFGTWVFL